MLRIKFTERNEKMEIVECSDNELKNALLESVVWRVESELSNIEWRRDIKKRASDVIVEESEEEKIYTVEDEKFAKEIFKKQLANYKRKKEREGKSKEEVYKIALKKAKETGEEQFFYSYSKDSMAYQSDVDLINVYVQPDGTTKEEVINAH
jgi:hypothetical protein